METGKWKWSVDQWFEDKVWAKVPKEYQTPHFFFLVGLFSGALFVIILNIIFG